MKHPYLTFISLLIFIFSGVVQGNAKLGNFYISSVSQTLKTQMITSGIWKPGCPVPLDDLRVVSLSYYDFLHHSHNDGKVILHKSVANSALALFKSLYLSHFPFSTIGTLVKQGSNWQQAEESNVTYGFICKSDVKKGFLPESFGKVITINPVLNPEIFLITKNEQQSIKIQPRSGIFSVNRALKLGGMSESIEKILKRNGFVRLDLPENQFGWKKFIFQDTTDKNISQDITSTTNYYLNTTEKSNQAPVFTAEPLSILIKEKLKKSRHWMPDCPVPLERLSLLTLSYYDFSGKIHKGNLIVFDGVAPHLLKAFEEFYQRKFPLEEVVAFDVPDMKEQTMAFNCRNIVGESKVSLHSYGLAIDINVSRNPYLGAYEKDHNAYIGKLIPYGTKSLSYVNRPHKRLGMNEAIIKIMAKNGFIVWGGNWEDRIDYMHFQVPRNIVENIIYLDQDNAQQLMQLVIQYPEAANKMSADKRWNYLYELYPENYIRVLKKYFSRLKTEEEIKVINRVYLELINCCHPFRA